MSEWYRRRTFRAVEFDRDELIARKRASGLTVSVVLPSYNEAETVAGMVAACAELAGSLVDELVVMDGSSTDGTPELAAEAGARVHDDSQVLPEFGPARGKGDALWRSLAVTSGDAVVFVDSDIKNPDPRFVWGLLAPLLHEPDIQLVKAFYDRPVRVGDELQASGGGRVTELCARPVLNLLWPELAGLIQPLSGEYAGRRSLLEQLPFFTGYGVEIGLLIDALGRVGAEAIAQVDVAERIHHNQEVPALSRMAFGILQVALRRLADSGRGQLSLELPATYLQFARVEDHIEPQPSTVEILERPPMRSVAR